MLLIRVDVLTKLKEKVYQEFYSLLLRAMKGYRVDYEFILEEISSIGLANEIDNSVLQYYLNNDMITNLILVPGYNKESGVLDDLSKRIDDEITRAMNAESNINNKLDEHIEEFKWYEDVELHKDSITPESMDITSSASYDINSEVVLNTYKFDDVHGLVAEGTILRRVLAFKNQLDNNPMTLTVYGQETPITDLEAATRLGTVTDNNELTISEGYPYIVIISKSNPVYIDKINLYWE